MEMIPLAAKTAYIIWHWTRIRTWAASTRGPRRATLTNYTPRRMTTSMIIDYLSVWSQVILFHYYKLI